jgi:glycosyltransferase involved in cell wall biosynthesis
MQAGDLELVCVGDGPLREEIARRKIPGVRLMGALAPANVRDWMLRARVLVAPSTWYEMFGLVVAEAMAAGFPVIVPRVGALAEVTAGGAAVAHTEFADVHSLTNDLVAALQVVRDDGLIDLAGKSGRARFPRRSLVRQVELG